LADGHRRRPTQPSEEILVIGLGRFGGRLALELVELGHDVLGVDVEEAIVQRFAPLLTKAIAADTTRPEVLEQLRVSTFNHVVVGVGDVEASILTVAELVTLGVTDIWAKAVTESHRRILDKVGATHIVLPEHEMGRRVAHRVTGKVMDYIELDEAFALVETQIPAHLSGRTLREANLRAEHGVTVVCVKPPDGAFTYATPETVLDEGTLVLVAGETDRVERFAERA
jgi:trk system potassium uptake protein TrkA